MVLQPDDINKYLMTKLAEPRSLADGRPRVHDILVNNASGMLHYGYCAEYVFPIWCRRYLAPAGGRSLMKLAFRWTRNLRVTCTRSDYLIAMFDAISGGPIVDVLSTGVDHPDDAVARICKPCRRGWGGCFFWWVYAACDGCRAFVVAALTTVPYSSVIIAAIIPAIAIFSVCLSCRFRHVNRISSRLAG